jgi:hypothetical protein
MSGRKRNSSIDWRWSKKRKNIYYYYFVGFKLSLRMIITFFSFSHSLSISNNNTHTGEYKKIIQSSSACLLIPLCGLWIEQKFEWENKEEIISIMEWLSCGVCVFFYGILKPLNTQISVHPSFSFTPIHFYANCLRKNSWILFKIIHFATAFECACERDESKTRE